MCDIKVLRQKDSNKGKMSVRLVLVTVACLTITVESSQDVIKQMTINFAKPMELCKKELDLPDAVIEDFNNFWKEDYELKSVQTGCAILCISAKLELLDSSLKLHHGRAQEFALKHGADEAMAKQLIEMIHECGHSTPMFEDPCEKTLEVSKCFKTEIHKLNWAPSLDLVVGELLAET